MVPLLGEGGECLLGKIPLGRMSLETLMKEVGENRAVPFSFQGDNYEEAMRNIKDVIQMCLEELKDGRKKPGPKYPKVISLKWVEVTIWI